MGKSFFRMNWIHKHPWLSGHLRSFVRFYACLKKRFLLLLLLVLSLFTFFFSIAYYATDIRTDFRTGEVFTSIPALIAYFRLLDNSFFLLALVYSFASLLAIIWALCCWQVFLVERLAADFLFRLFFKSDNYNDQCLIDADTILREELKNKNRFYIFSISSICIIVYFILRRLNVGGPDDAKALGIVICYICIPSVYLLHWRHFIQFEKNKSLRIDLARYIYSPYTIRRRFKNILDALLFFIILTLFLIPLYFGAVTHFSEYVSGRFTVKIGYDKLYEEVASDSNNLSELSKRGIWTPIKPNEFDAYLNPFANLSYNKQIRQASLTLKRYFFIAVIIICLFEIIVPLLLEIKRRAGFRQALKRVGRASVKSFFFILIINLIVEKGYEQNMSSTILGSFFSFILTFFLVFDDKAVHEDNRNSRQRRPKQTNHIDETKTPKLE